MEKPLKEKTAALRRQHILEAAARRFAEVGYQRTTIRDIAMAAGVADGTVYNSFANKADLLLGLLDPLQAHLPGGQDGTVPATALSRDAVIGLLQARWAALSPDIIDMLRVVLAEALIDDQVRGAFTTRILAPAILPLETAIRDAGGDDPPLAARGLVAVFLGGVILRMLGDAVLDAEADALGARLAAILKDPADRTRAG
jgi:AcrR family transcriptional regulator